MHAPGISRFHARQTSNFQGVIGELAGVIRLKSNTVAELLFADEQSPEKLKATAPPPGLPEKKNHAKAVKTRKKGTSSKEIKKNKATKTALLNKINGPDRPF